MPIDLPQSRLRAPELTGGEGWLNTPRPLALAALRGKVVILDYCCINCMHVLPELKRLERDFPDELTVIGVHSAEFTNEGETSHIREAIGRYEIEHPVVNDRRFAIWQAYGVRAWPTLIVIDPEGHIVGAVSGEGHGARLHEVVGALVEEARVKGTLDPRPGRDSRPSPDREGGILAYPGKVLIDELSGRLFIADTNHHRVLVTTVHGQVTASSATARQGLTTAPSPTRASTIPRGWPWSSTCSSWPIPTTT